MKTGRDVVIAALLGADEFGFATAPLVAQGCIMMRVCHLGTCPVGIATQDPELRKRFEGKPEHVINYFFFVAEQVRQYMAQLGYRSFDEMVGQVQDLKPSSGPRHWKTRGLDFTKILHRELPRSGDGLAYHPWRRTFAPTPVENGLVNEIRRSVEAGRSIHLEARISNSDRSFGAYLSGEMVRWGGSSEVSITLRGSAGQSFGAFLTQGLKLSLIGDANDYVGKGMSGGSIAIRLPSGVLVASEKSVIAGNTVLYGATGGKLFLAGCAGERFAVRNSGSIAVVEGVGDHACEYMTGGCVIVLGEFGRNFGAGMSGGYAYLYDPDRRLGKRINKESGLLEEEVTNDAELKGLIKEHYERTGSAHAKALLSDWEHARSSFVRVIPKEYKALTETQPMEANQIG
jgi:glutamate synthase (NADPH/NADH) large chain